VAEFIQDTSIITPPVDEPDEGTGPYTAGDLAIAGVPKEFNFGRTAISNADTLLATKEIVQKDYYSTENTKDDSSKTKYPAGNTQGVTIYDGRVLNDSWAVAVSSTQFVNTADSTKKLVGATIVIDPTATRSIDGPAGQQDIVGPTGNKFTIVADGATSTANILKAGTTKAKGHSRLEWNVGDVKLAVPGDQLSLGEYKATVTWTLTGTPDA
jgi:hypothetical protein